MVEWWIRASQMLQLDKKNVDWNKIYKKENPLFLFVTIIRAIGWLSLVIGGIIFLVTYADLKTITLANA